MQIFAEVFIDAKHFRAISRPSDQSENKFGVNISWLHAAKYALGNVNIKFEDYALFYLQYIAPQSTVHM